MKLKSITRIKKHVKFGHYIAKYGVNLLRFPFISHSAVFSEIYNKKIWHHSGSISGDGSTHEATAALRERLPSVLTQYSINSILDIPCGDFSWISELITGEMQYTGADIVPELVRSNKKKVAKLAECGEFRIPDSGAVSFLVLDICEDNLPHADLIFCRDCLVHLSNKLIFKVLKNIGRSTSEYIMLTHFPKQVRNYNIITGAWRPLNFEKPPYSFPPPLELINEKCTIRQGHYTDKSMGLWKISDLPLLS